MRHLTGLLTAALLIFTSFVANAATITVGTGGCTLYDAIEAANDDEARGNCPAGLDTDTIRIPGSPPLVLDAGSPLPTITSTIYFEPVSGIATLDLNENTSMFRIENVIDTRFTDLVITNGRPTSGIQGGGRIMSIHDSSVDFYNVVFTDNTHSYYPGGGIFYAVDSHVLIINSKFLNNIDEGSYICRGSCPDAPRGTVTARNSWLEIYRSEFTGQDNDYPYGVVLGVEGTTLEIFQSLFDTGPTGRVSVFIDLDVFSEAEIENTTFSSQILEEDFSLIARSSNQISLNNVTLSNVDLDLRGIAELSNTIFAGNCQRTNPGVIGLNTGNWFTTGNCGTPASGDLFLLSLLDRGGSTRTHALHWLSDAIDAGSNTHCPDEDQRSVERDASCDIGAFERIDVADISLVIGPLNNGPFYFGQDLVYQVALANGGPGVANNVQVNFGTSNLMIDSVSGACTSIPCVVNSVIPGASRTIYVHAHPSVLPASGFTLSADAVNGPGSVYTDPVPGNNSDVENDNQSPAADLSVSKTFLSTPPFVVGQSISYEIEVENHGPSQATGVVLSDIGTGLNITGISNCNNPPAGPCSLPNLSNGDSLTRTVTAEITATTFDNLAIVGGSVYDPIPDNNTDDTGNNGQTESDADVRASTNVISGGPYISGDIVSFGIALRNYGPDSATNATLQPITSGGTIVGVRDGCMVLPCNFGIVPNDTIVDAVVDVQINGPGLVTLQLFASADQTDINQVNNIDDASVNAEASADIGVSLTPLTPPPYYRGQQIVYALNVSNLGFDPATNVEVAITTQNLDIVSALGDFCLELPCTIPVLDIVQTESIEVVASPINTGPFDFTVSGSADQFDFQPANDSDITGNGGTALQFIFDLLFRDGME